jgi:hypothetical protein
MMLHRVGLSVLALCLVAQVASLAQEAPVVVLQSWKCDITALPELRAFSDSSVMTLAQELVDEGKFDFVQMLETSFGDEWNVVYYYRSRDLDTYFAAWEAWGTRINDEYAEGAAWWYELCPEVKHSMYRATVLTEMRMP